MRTTMDPLNPMASTLDPAIAHIYSQASAIRDSIRASVPRETEDTEARKRREKQKRLQRLAREVLDTPERVRYLVRNGRLEDAKREWEMPKKLLENWREKGVGGDDVLVCLADGEAALRGEETGYRWREDEKDEGSSRCDGGQGANS